MPPKKGKPSQIEKDIHQEDDHQEQEEEQELKFSSELTQLSFAPVLDSEGRRLDSEEAPLDYKQNFKSSFWDFPAFVADKDGHCPGGSDVIAAKLADQATKCSGELNTLYLAYAEEWKALRQSTIYGHLIQAALIQVNSKIESSEAELPGDLQRVLQHLEVIITNLTSDLLKRSSVIITAAKHSQAGAERIAQVLEAETTGLHPAAERAFQDLPPAPSRRAKEAAIIRKPASTKWTPPKKKDQDAPQAQFKKPFRKMGTSTSSGPFKTGVDDN